MKPLKPGAGDALDILQGCFEEHYHLTLTATRHLHRYPADYFSYDPAHTDIHMRPSEYYGEPTVCGRAKMAQWWKCGSINQHLNARKKRASATMVMCLVFAKCTLEPSIR